jgi:hypothetical protein
MPSDELAELVARASAPAEAGQDGYGRRQALAELIPVLARSAKAAGVRSVLAGRWLVDQVIAVAPRVPVRNARTLQAQNPGLTDLEIAEGIIKTASRTTAGVGAAAGGLAAVEFTAPPALLAAPIQLAAEIIVVTAIELKMVAELHEILGHPAVGSVTERSSAYLLSWVRRRGVTPEIGAVGVTAILSTAAKRELRVQLLRRLGKSTTTLAPFLAGAVAGAEVNRRTTRLLGQTLLGELLSQSEQRWFRQLW